MFREKWKKSFNSKGSEAERLWMRTSIKAEWEKSSSTIEGLLQMTRLSAAVKIIFNLVTTESVVTSVSTPKNTNQTLVKKLKLRLMLSIRSEAIKRFVAKRSFYIFNDVFLVDRRECASHLTISSRHWQCPLPCLLVSKTRDSNLYLKS